MAFTQGQRATHLARIARDLRGIADDVRLTARNVTPAHSTDHRLLVEMNWISQYTIRLLAAQSALQMVVMGFAPPSPEESSASDPRQ